MAEEVAEVRLAMSQLRDALDDSEKQARDLEKEKADLRRAFDETQSRLEKLQKSSKVCVTIMPFSNSYVLICNRPCQKSSVRYKQQRHGRSTPMRSLRGRRPILQDHDSHRQRLDLKLVPREELMTLIMYI